MLAVHACRPHLDENNTANIITNAAGSKATPTREDSQDFEVA
jgi:hypothetical protein